MKNTVITFREAKGREKLSVLTAYDYSTARLMDQEDINALLVGDSLGMVMLGHADTLSVTLEDMIRHCAAVARGSREALVICDMPFMSYQISVAETLRNAGRLISEQLLKEDAPIQRILLPGEFIVRNSVRNLKE